MNQRHLQNISHVSVDVSLIVENVTQSKNETIISVNVSVKNNKTLQM